jgi:hypothetical protein
MRGESLTNHGHVDNPVMTSLPSQTGTGHPDPPVIDPDNYMLLARFIEFIGQIWRKCQKSHGMLRLTFPNLFLVRVALGLLRIVSLQVIIS